MKFPFKWKRRLYQWKLWWSHHHRRFRISYKGVEVELYDLNKKAAPWFRGLSIALVVLATASLVFSLGFEPSAYWKRWNEWAEIVIILGFFTLYLGRLILTSHKKELLRDRVLETALFVLFIIFLLVYNLMPSLWSYAFGNLFGIQSPHDILIALGKFFMVLIIMAKFFQITPVLLEMQRNPGKLLAASFLGIILVGALLLMMPRTTVDGQGLRFIDALFTSTSAVCVTGLIVVDTATQLTTLGQVIVLVLIQLGGIGIVTFATFFALFLSGGLGMGQMSFLRDIVQESNVSKTLGALRRIVLITLTVEALGALSYYLSWDNLIPDPGKRLYFSIFHAVSAFCNAGFSLFTNSLADKANALNWGVNITTMILIIVGGLGFTTVWEILRGNRNHRIKRKRFSVHSKLVLVTTAVLIVGGALAVGLLEWHGELAGYGWAQKVMMATFQSVTSRTAGFNTINTGALGISATMVIMLLMAIGASPASTGGGIKTTSIAILYLGVLATLRGHHRVELGKKTIPSGTVFTAITALTLAAITLFVSTLLLTITEHLSFVDLLFEEISAYATVGLSRGITSSLSDAGKCIIIVSMYVGRVGSVTLAAAFAKREEKRKYKYPRESVIVA